MTNKTIKSTFSRRWKVKTVLLNARPNCRRVCTGWLGRTVLPTPIFPNFRNCTKRIELGSSYSSCRLTWTRPTVVDITLSDRWYTGGPAPLPLISVFSVYLKIVWASKFTYSMEVNIETGTTTADTRKLITRWEILTCCEYMTSLANLSVLLIYSYS